MFKRMEEENAGISFDVLYDDCPLPISLALDATIIDLKNQLEQYTGIPATHQMILNLPDNANDSSVLASMDLKNIEMIQVEPEVAKPPTTQPPQQPTRNQDVNSMMERIVVDDDDIQELDDDDDDDMIDFVNSRPVTTTTNNHNNVERTTTTTVTNDDGTTTTTTSTVTNNTINGVTSQSTTTTSYTTTSNTGSPNLVGQNHHFNTNTAATASGYVTSPYATNFFPETDQLSAQNLIDFLDQLYYPTFASDMFEQYGTIVPESFSGSFKDAIAFAKKRGRLLLTYLHSDNEVSLAFVLDILRSEEVSEFIKENFVFWVARITPEAESFLFSLVQFESYPILVTLMNLGSPEILEVSQGVNDKEQFFNKLVNHITTNQMELDRVRVEEEENDRARMIVQEQDQAYEESLKADKEKKEKAESEKMAIENKKIAKLGKGILVSDEPAKGPNSTQIVFKLPDDSKLERRFNSDDKIEMLCNYLDGQGCEIDNYQFITMYPKRVFKKSDFNLTFKEAGLSPQSILNVRADE